MKVEIPIWPGSSSFSELSASFYTGSSTTQPTPFGYFDSDTSFVSDADKVAAIGVLIDWDILLLM